MADEDDRLLLAVERSLLPALVPQGFRIGPATANKRGASVTIVAERAQILVHADWLEGEVVVEIQRLGQQAMTALEVTRLPRNVKASVLESRLRKNADAIVTEVTREV